MWGSRSLCHGTSDDVRREAGLRTSRIPHFVWVRGHRSGPCAGISPASRFSPRRGTSCLSPVTIASTVVSTVPPLVRDRRRHRRRRLDRAVLAPRAGPHRGARRCWSAGQRHAGDAARGRRSGHARTWPSPVARRDCPASSSRTPGSRVVVVASGDPFVSGIGTTLVDLLGAEQVRGDPGRLVGGPGPGPDGLVGGVDRGGLAGRPRPYTVLLRQLAPGHRLLVLSSDEATPASVAGLLAYARLRDSRLVVLGDLGAAEESRVEGTAATWSAEAPRAQRRRASTWTGRSSARGSPACPTTPSSTTGS